MDALSLLLKRQSYNQLTEPAPEGICLENILQAGVTVPDHGGLTPWRFIVFRGQALDDLGEIYAEAREAQGADCEKISKARNMPLRAPLVIAIIADVKDSPKIPRLEQLVAAGCSAQAMQMAAFAQGYQGIWRTGDLAYDAHVKKQLKLKEADEIIGFLYLGTAKSEPPVKTRKPAAEFVEYWLE
ncbi:NAD(P)H nitroreductase [Catenovulum sp. SM1970]|uniref:NAD(P)H nitroreductase n=1 Tax=Marinifaba aquimaris TaxID=2741323 RepID=UPI001574627E|nr:NAD(P)H nitroreductase [Marinifaba aquimaris]NTS76009.1 NAD(P)H nitroreductase [Marinifaba aquimaris]